MKQLDNYEKMTVILNEFKMILNEKVCDQLLFAVNGYVDEMNAKAKATVISPELEEFEKLFSEYKRVCEDASKGQGPGGKIYLDHISRRIKEVYGS